MDGLYGHGFYGNGYGNGKGYGNGFTATDTEYWKSGISQSLSVSAV